MTEDLFNDDYDLDQNDGDINVNKFMENKASFTNDKLCDIIAANRYLNINEEVTILCMEELSNRRSNGDNFDFESTINSKLQELPPLDNVSLDLRLLVKQLNNSIKG